MRFASDISECDLAIVCTLNRPNSKILPLLFAAATARELGARKIGLVAPYLAYMRQDQRFKPGEAITSRQVAHLLSDAFDWLITVDPHLHRYGSLSEIYRIPTTVVHAASLMSEWIKSNIANPIIIGPDSESEQWVSAVAKDAGAPYTVLQKVRRGDREVEITFNSEAFFPDRTSVLIDDIISSGRTMIEVIRLLKTRGMRGIVCVAVHGLFADGCDKLITQAGARIVTSNSVPHPSNEIDVSELMAGEIRNLTAAKIGTGQA